MASSTAANGIFRPVASKAENKSDATTRAARDIMKGEVNHREAKTARLRAARLAAEAAAADAEAAAPPAPPVARKTRRATKA